MGSKHCCRDDQRRGASGWLTPCRGKALEKVAFQAVMCLGSPCDCADVLTRCPAGPWLWACVSLTQRSPSYLDSQQTVTAPCGSHPQTRKLVKTGLDPEDWDLRSQGLMLNIHVSAQPWDREFTVSLKPWV